MKPDANAIRGKVEKLEASLIAIGELLLEVRGLLSPEQLTAWLKAEIGLDLAEAERTIQAAQRARAGGSAVLTMFEGDQANCWPGAGIFDTPAAAPGTRSGYSRYWTRLLR